MKLSIIVPTYNAAPYLEACIKSLLDQDLEHETFEIIIINDGSKDESLTIAENLAHQYNNITVKTQQNKGVSAVRNLGIKLAKGDFILFIDADDTIEKNTLSKMLSFTQKNQLEISMFGMVKVKDDLVIETLSDRSTERLSVVTGISLYEHRLIDSACKYFFSKDLLLKNKIVFNPNASFVEDGEFLIKAFCVAEKTAYLHLDFYNYHMRPNSAVNSNVSLSKKAMLGFFESAKAIIIFQSNPSLNHLQKQFLNQAIVKFSVMPIFVSAQLKTIKQLLSAIQLTYQNKNISLPTKGVIGYRKTHAQLYNLSIVFLAFFLLVVNTLQSLKNKFHG